jgi:hypothetical protein
MSHAITRAPTTSNTPVKAAVMASVELCTPKIEKSIKDVSILFLIFGGLSFIKSHYHTIAYTEKVKSSCVNAPNLGANIHNIY